MEDILYTVSEVTKLIKTNTNYVYDMKLRNWMQLAKIHKRKDG